MKNEKFLLDIQTKCGDIANEILNAAIDAERNSNASGLIQRNYLKTALIPSIVQVFTQVFTGMQISEFLSVPDKLKAD